MTNEDYIAMCDQTLDYIRRKIRYTKTDERRAIVKNQMLILRLRTYYVRKQRFDARH